MPTEPEAVLVTGTVPAKKTRQVEVAMQQSIIMGAELDEEGGRAMVDAAYRDAAPHLDLPSLAAAPAHSAGGAAPHRALLAPGPAGAFPGGGLPAAHGLLGAHHRAGAAPGFPGAFPGGAAQVHGGGAAMTAMVLGCTGIYVLPRPHAPVERSTAVLPFFW